MYLKKLLILCPAAILLFSCGPSANSSLEVQHNDTLAPASDPQLGEQPVKTIIAFLEWYKGYHFSGKTPMVMDTAFVQGDTTRYYRVNFKGTEEYLGELKNSGFVSEEYLEGWRKDFRRSDEYMRTHPENDGPPNGFDYDLVTLSQEDIGLDSLERTKVGPITKEAGGVRVRLEFPNYAALTYRLHQEGDRWLIDKVSVE
jgi:hypothetical protein